MRTPYEALSEDHDVFDEEAESKTLEDKLQFTQEQLQEADNACTYLAAIALIHQKGMEPCRGWECIYRYSIGDSLEDIGEIAGVTRERVRQIINSTHPNISAPRVRAAYRAQKKKEQQDLQRAVYEWSVYNPEQRGEVCESEFGITKQQVKHILKGRSALHYPVAPRTIGDNQKEWQEQELIDLLRQWWTECTDHRSMSFNDWSVARGGPTRQTPILRFGKWSHALAKAGLGDEHSKPRKRRARYSDADMWAALVQFVATPREKYTYLEFETYARSISGMPSAALVRRQLMMSWNVQVETAKSIIRGDYTELPSKVVAAGIDNILQQRNWADEYTRPKAGTEEYTHLAIGTIQQYIGQNGRRVVVSRYDEWAQKHDKPVGITLINKSGLKWADLVQRAGGVCGTRYGHDLTAENIQYRNEHALACIREYIEYEEKEPTYERYIAWANNAGDEYPKGKALRNWFGGWRNALAQARGL